MTTSLNKLWAAKMQFGRLLGRPRSIAAISVTMLIAPLSLPSSANAQTAHHAVHKSAHKTGSGMTPAQKRQYDAAVASGIGDLQAVHADTEAQRAATAAAIEAYSRPNDSAAAERYGQAKVAADRAQTRVDRSVCSDPDALATRMRDASLQEQNYLTTLCRTR